MSKVAPLFNGLEGTTIASSFDEKKNSILFAGDVFEFLNDVPDNSIQLIVTSPPYNIGKEYEKRVPIEEYLESQKKVIKELYRVLKKEGSICWQVGNYVNNGEIYPLDIYFYPIFKSLGMQLRNRVVWRFGHGLHASKRFSGRYETLLWFSKTDEYLFNLDPVRVPSKYPGKRHFKGPKKGQLSGNPLGKNPSDVWEIITEDWETAFWDIPNVKSNHPEKTGHPAQFPIALVERCVLAFTNENDWVFDPYSGAGSSLIAALMHGRKAAGSEKEKEYIEYARDRISSLYNGTLKYRPIGKSVHQPTGKEKISQYPREWEAQQKQLLEEKEDYS